MADPKGFLTTTQRELPGRRPIPIRLQDWREVYTATDEQMLRREAVEQGLDPDADGVWVKIMEASHG